MMSIYFNIISVPLNLLENPETREQGDKEDFHTYYESGTGVLVYDTCVAGSIAEVMDEGGKTTDFYVTPEGVAIPQADYHSLSDLDAKKWYLSQEATIPDLIDYNQPLKQQAYQVFS